MVLRPLYKEELLSIKNGEWKYDDLLQWADNQQKKLDDFYMSGKSPLPKKPNLKKINELCIEIIEECFKI